MAEPASDMQLVVCGATGRMGQSLIRAIHSTPGVALFGAVERAGSDKIGADAGVLAGIGETGVMITDDPLPVFATAEGVLDFTAPAASVEYSALAAQARIVHVIGTTGCGAEDEAKFRAAARHAVVVKSGNMSLGVNLLAVLVEQAARALDADFDIEILEMHHRHKVDAPSGTALTLGASAAAGGAAPRHASIRAGDIVGEHLVQFTSVGERIELVHRASNRDIFHKQNCLHWVIKVIVKDPGGDNRKQGQNNG